MHPNNTQVHIFDKHIVQFNFRTTPAAGASMGEVERILMSTAGEIPLEHPENSGSE